jgi:hypothetical protein
MSFRRSGWGHKKLKKDAGFEKFLEGNENKILKGQTRNFPHD